MPTDEGVNLTVEKTGGFEVTVKLTTVDSTSEPEVPVIVTLYVPIASVGPARVNSSGTL